jgi:hypothetical protein
MSRIVADPGVSAHGLALALEDLDRHTAGSLATDRRTSMVCLPACLPSSSVPFGTPSSENSLPGTIHYTALKTSHACLQHPQPLLDLGQPRTPSPVDVRLRTRNRDLLLHSRHFGRTSRPPSRAAEPGNLGRLRRWMCGFGHEIATCCCTRATSDGQADLRRAPPSLTSWDAASFALVSEPLTSMKSRCHGTIRWIVLVAAFHAASFRLRRFTRP